MSYTDINQTSSNSTGPRTEEGKAVSSRNAVKHNLCSTRLTGTDLEEYNALRATLEEEWEPSTDTERLLLDQMALSKWRMDRALSLELNAFNEDHLDEKLLALALRYRTTAERSFYKALTELQRLQRTIERATEIRYQQEKEEAEALIRHIAEGPIGTLPPELTASQFVSQNPKISARPTSKTGAEGTAEAPLKQAAA